MSGGRSEMSWCLKNFSGGVDAMTRDSARAMVMTIGLYLVYGAYLSPPLVLASNRLDGSQYGIPVRRPKKGSWLGESFLFRA
jgi:hypothetical protein